MRNDFTPVNPTAQMIRTDLLKDAHYKTDIIKKQKNVNSLLSDKEIKLCNTLPGKKTLGPNDFNDKLKH